MSFKNKIRLRQRRKSAERRKERKRLKKLRIKKADKNKKLKISELHALAKPELSEKAIVEEIVKRGATKGAIRVNFDRYHYFIDVKNISPKKVVYSVDMGKDRCALLEGFNKLILLNRERATSMLASAII